MRALLRGRIPAVVLLFASAAVFGLVKHDVPVALCTVLLGVCGAGQMLLTGALRSAQNLLPEAALKLTAGALTMAVCGVCLGLGGHATVLVAGLAAAALIIIAPTWLIARKVLAPGGEHSARRALRDSWPLGAMALATIAYYRAGTVVLKVVSSPGQTSLFAAASTVAFALLMFSNAITTGLLPKLGATPTDEHPELVRRAVAYATVVGVILAAAVAAGAQPLMHAMFGAKYVHGAGALRILALSTALIAPTGVLGTALIGSGRLRVLYWQVGLSLLVSLLCLFTLGGALGATGGALATLSCEALAFMLIAAASRPMLMLRSAPGGRR